MEQDLIEWLREKNSQNETALLVVPVNVAQSDDTPATENLEIKNFEVKNENENNENLEQTEIPEVKTLSEWHETAAKLDLSLDEPPIELWTQINESIEDDDDGFEQSMSLQGNAYVQIPTEHGKNFTQRLHRTLKERQQKAEFLREEEEKERQKQHPYTFKAIILCSVLIMEIALACIILFALNRYSLIKNFEPVTEQFEANIQKENHENHEIEIILPQIQSHDEEIKTESYSGDLIGESEDNTTLTFEELLQEGNRAYNTGVYDMAVLIFHSAVEMNRDDIRPYIGLIESYRAKKMYFDSNRILEKARIKFGINPTLETELKILRGENKNERKRCKRK